jgi:putative Flp pilus-assembly TadE/G-like protein
MQRRWIEGYGVWTSSGKILVLYALLLPLLLGMVGVVIDGGMIMAGHLRAQSAADVAALAAAKDLADGKASGTAVTTGSTYVQQYNGLSNATVTVNIPPTLGQYAGIANHAEAIIALPVNTTFIQMLGISAVQTVVARAVADFEPNPSNDGVAVLDPTIVPGLSVQGGGSLVVDGRITINSPGKGTDQNGQTIDLGYPQSAATSGNGAVVKGKRIYVVGGVDVPANYQAFASGGPNPLHAGSLPKPDPFLAMPVPQAGMAGVDTTLRGDFQVSGGTWTIDPGIYNSIKITNSATVTFNPGIYIIAATSNNAITITGSGTVLGNGVMFYNTGSDYTPTAPPDLSDGEARPPTKIPGNPNFGDVTINASNVSLSGLVNPSSPFNGMLFFQRRWNTNGINIQGSGSTTSLVGTLYAKWAQFKLSGSANYQAQFIAGSLAISGQANITLVYPPDRPKLSRIFLVE